MFEFTDTERDGYAQSGRLSVDASGKEVLLGLTREQTELVVLHTRSKLAGARPTHAARTRVLALLNEHEKVRIAVSFSGPRES